MIRPRPSTNTLIQAVRAAGGSLHVDEAARLLFRSQATGSVVARKVVLALAAGDPGLTVASGDLVCVAAPQALATALNRIRFVIVDLETTGSRPGDDRITEIGAVRLQGRKIGESYQSLVRPDRPIPAAVTRLTGIHEMLLAGAPRFERVAGKFLDFLGDGVLVAHNASFDVRFLAAGLEDAGLAPPVNPVLCSLRLARLLLPELRSCSLDSLASHFGFTFRARHRALGDAEVTAQILRELLSGAERDGVDNLGALLDLSRRRRARKR